MSIKTTVEIKCSECEVAWTDVHAMPSFWDICLDPADSVARSISNFYAMGWVRDSFNDYCPAHAHIPENRRPA